MWHHCFNDSRVPFILLINFGLNQHLQILWEAILPRSFSLLFPWSILQLKLGCHTAFEKKKLSSVTDMSYDIRAEHFFWNRNDSEIWDDMSYDIRAEYFFWNRNDSEIWEQVFSENFRSSYRRNTTVCFAHFSTNIFNISSHFY